MGEHIKILRRGRYSWGRIVVNDILKPTSKWCISKKKKKIQQVVIRFSLLHYLSQRYFTEPGRKFRQYRIYLEKKTFTNSWFYADTLPRSRIRILLYCSSSPVADTWHGFYCYHCSCCILKFFPRTVVEKHWYTCGRINRLNPVY